MIESSQDDNDFGTALTYSARAPLAWVFTEDASPERFDTENEQCLRTILNLSEHHTIDVTEELAAIERKVDITLEMVAMLLKESIDMPVAKAFTLGAHEITWQPLAPLPELGVNLDIAVYLHDLYPKPLMLTGQVKSINEDRCTVALMPKSTEVQQLLEKFIFLHHRRAIAQAKNT